MTDEEYKNQIDLIMEQARDGLIPSHSVSDAFLALIFEKWKKKIGY